MSFFKKMFGSVSNNGGRPTCDICKRRGMDTTCNFCGKRICTSCTKKVNGHDSCKRCN